MKINDIFEQRKKRWASLVQLRKNVAEVMETCGHCKEEVSQSLLKETMWICPSCGFHMGVSPMDRIEMIADENSFKELYKTLKTQNPIDFPGYEKKLRKSRELTGQQDAVVTGVCSIADIKVAVGVLDARFFMGSMGTVVGEKITRLAEYAAKRKLPLIIFSASGGARMQEGLFSLFQMAKTSAAIERYKESGGLFISYLTNPTTGGVSASFATLGDIIIAEPDALICFAGPRVIQQTIGQTLPEGFQHAEFLLEHGMLDLIIERDEMKDTLANLLKLHVRRKRA